MARKTPEAWIDDLVAAAAEAFTRDGYRRTQMADIARAMGVSAGSLYRYVTGKEALFDLVVQRAFAKVPPSLPALPIPAPGREALLQHLRERGDWQADLPTLVHAATPRSRTRDIGREVASVIGELFDYLSRQRQGLALIERCAADRPELVAVYFGELRSSLLESLERWIERRAAQGHFAPVGSAAATARVLIEGVAYLAWKRHRDPWPDAYDQPVARETVISLYTRALVSEDST